MKYYIYMENPTTWLRTGWFLDKKGIWTQQAREAVSFDTYEETFQFLKKTYNIYFDWDWVPNSNFITQMDLDQFLK